MRIETGSIIKGRYNGYSYEILRFLGRGGTGDVYLARDANNNKRALKISSDLFSITKEYDALLKLKGFRFVPEIFDLDDAILYNTLYHYIVIEYINGQNLSYLIKKSVGLNTAVQLCIFLCDAMMNMAKKGIYYSDLKPENIMIDKDNKRIVVVDFGCVLKKGESIKEFTKAYDRASWSMGERRVDGGYMSFQIGMIMINLVSGKTYNPENTSIAQVLKDSKQRLAHYYPIILKAVNGRCRISEMYSSLKKGATFIKVARNLNFALFASGVIFLILLNIAIRGLR